jgi:hypothetical protein
MKIFNKIETFSLSQFLLKLEYSSFIYYASLLSRVGPLIGGLIPKEEKVE